MALGLHLIGLATWEDKGPGSLFELGPVMRFAQKWWVAGEWWSQNLKALETFERRCFARQDFWLENAVVPYFELLATPLLHLSHFRKVKVELWRKTDTDKRRPTWNFPRSQKYLRFTYSLDKLDIRNKESN